MKSDLLQDAIGEVRADWVLDADRASGRKRKGLMKWGMAAACACLLIGGMKAAFFRQEGSHVQQWSEAFRAEDYFRYSDGEGISSSGGSQDYAVVQYAERRFFSDWRQELESGSVLPEMDTHPLFTLRANYNADGSLYSLNMSWHRRDREGTEHYSDLAVTAGYEEVPAVTDCVVVETDEQGNVLEPAVTVTEREGIRIIGEGGEGRDKTLTFQTEEGWYRITGSWNDDYESVAGLLDWFWEHPIPFDLFPMEKGDNYIWCSYSERPDAFAEYLPSFEDFGFICQEAGVMLKNGVPSEFEGHYLSGVTPEQAESGEYGIGENGCASIHWCLETEPDFYDLEECMGDMEDITEEQVMNLMPPDAVTAEVKIKFRQGDCVVTVYASDAAEAWRLMESLR